MSKILPIAVAFSIVSVGTALTLSPSLSAVASNASSSEPQAKVKLQGSVREEVTPFAADGSTQSVPEGTKANFTVLANFNSELTKVGDEVVAMVSTDITNESNRVMLPGQWCAHGKVTEVSRQKRLNRAGYITIQFDKLVSPDGRYQIPFDAEATTKESVAKSVAKHVATDSLYMTKGAVAGAILSVQVTGIPMAIATHGYSVAGGAAIGAGIGLIGALKRKGDIACVLPGEEMKLSFVKPVTLPVFNEQALPSAIPHPKLENFEIVVSKAKFQKDPFGDKHSRLLRVDFCMNNQTDAEYGFGNVVIVSDHNRMYYPYALSTDSKIRTKKIPAKSVENATMTFSVDGPKRKYWLVLLDRGNKNELTRAPIN